MIELPGRCVRGRHHHHIAVEQALKQPAQDHGVGYIGHVQLVEAEQLGLLCDRLRHMHYRIAAMGLARLPDAFMDIGP